ncbi:MAG: POTRA domain-containing protein [Flavisolibacter sp.]
MRLFYPKACFAVLILASGKSGFAQASVSENTIVYSTDISSSVPDSNHVYTIRNISISGNRKTKPNIILREIAFEINGTYPLEEIVKRFEKARKQLMNTGLFQDVVVSLKSISGYDMDVNINVYEKWYIWPKPYLKSVDKSFHEWWSETDRSMERINYGIRLTHNNFTGRRDKLKLSLMNGYTKQVSVQYYGLFLDNELKWSTNLGVTFGKNREVSYMTMNNRQVPVKDEHDFLRSYFSWFAQVNYRPAIKTTHTFGVGYNYENLADTIYKLNPHFSEQKNLVRYSELFYRLSYFDVDFIPYPTKGFIGELTLKRKGFNDPVNVWQFTAKASKSWPINKNYFFNLAAVGMVKLPFKQPYVTNQFIGYDEQYLQGYEYYVIDGAAGGYTKATLSRPLVNTFIRIPSQRFKCLNHIPFKLYAKTFVNAGYVYDERPGQNELANKIIYSGGIGLDIVTSTDFVVKIEWSFNRLGENGLYLHRRNYF